MSTDDREFDSQSSNPLMNTYARPRVTFQRGQGSYLFDTDGKRYLDFISGLAVTSLGHAHPQVADAICLQARTLSHVSNLYGNTLAPEVAATLDRLIGGGTVPGGGKVFFANSGAEANECALKLARRWAGATGDGLARGENGRYQVVSTNGSFHGRTLATLAATGQPSKQKPFMPLPTGFIQVPYDDLGALDEALDQNNVAAVIVEVIQGEGGVILPSPNYLAGVGDLCTKRNVLLIVDEIQTGLGRTGNWFAFQSVGLRPDIVTLAKALGNGMPVGACWARSEVAAAMGPGDHGSTFGGQPLAMAAVKATLAIMEEQDVCSRAKSNGLYLQEGLEKIRGVASVRGQGLLIACELIDDVASQVANASLDAGLLINPVRPSSLRFAPSLLVGRAEIDEALGILKKAIDEVIVEETRAKEY